MLLKAVVVFVAVGDGGICGGIDVGVTDCVGVDVAVAARLATAQLALWY